jgi:ZIP family zinc transporter
MGVAQTAALGAIAGATIYIGLPLGRSGRVGGRGRVALAMFSVGILAFIFMDVAGHGEELIAGALSDARAGRGSVASVLALFAVLSVGVVAGTACIPLAGRGIGRRRRGAAAPPIAGGEAATVLAPTELARFHDAAELAALRSAMAVAAAIGLHNLAEGLAIGAAARSGTIGLATVLVVGFALHNATEGFGIVGPLGAVRPSWRWLALAGLLAGGPTLLGTLIGFQVRSRPLELAAYALAAGAILYVIGEIWTATRRHGHKTVGLCLLAAGFLAGVATDLVVTFAGA